MYKTPGKNSVRIAVVIPCYEVEREIENVVSNLPPQIDCLILIDDASTDQTGNILDELARSQPERIVALHHEINQGVGGAVITGMKTAIERKADIIVKLDGDGQMNADYLPDLLQPILDGEADYVKGCRFHNLDVLKKMPPIRLLGNAGLSFLNRVASGYWNILDPTNGFFAVRSEVVKRIPETRLHRRFFFESSMLIELGILRAVVRDLPMDTFYGEETSHLSVTKTLLEFPPKLFRGFCRRIWMTKILLTASPDFILGFIGTILFFFGMCFGLYHWVFDSILDGQIATSGTVMLAALPCLLGMQLILSALLIDIQSVPTRPVSRPLFRQGFLWNHETPPDSSH